MWRNWQPRQTQDLVSCDVWVRVPSSAPKESRNVLLFILLLQRRTVVRLYKSKSRTYQQQFNWRFNVKGRKKCNTPTFQGQKKCCNYYFQGQKKCKLFFNYANYQQNIKELLQKHSYISSYCQNTSISTTGVQTTQNVKSTL